MSFQKTHFLNSQFELFPLIPQSKVHKGLPTYSFVSASPLSTSCFLLWFFLLYFSMMLSNLFTCVFHFRVCRIILLSGLVRLCLFQLHFLFLIVSVIWIRLHLFQIFKLKISFFQYMLIILRQLLINIC